MQKTGLWKSFGVEATYVRARAENSETVNCKEIYADFLIHCTNSRFIVYHESDAYIPDPAEDNPHIAIGTCSKF